ncbi:MAG: 5'/3'-nucleotidase SurE [Gemmataceae bacterium]
MRFLLTNDDGISAPGIVTLARAAQTRGAVHVVAPVAPSSGCGHQVTTHRPLRLVEHGPEEFAVEGWPVDCVRVALRGLELTPDWVLSGVNAGGNLGADVYISGTVAAVREAVLLGRPGIAFSHYKRRELDFDWPRVEGWVQMVLDTLLPRECPRGHFWNVNFPHLDPGTREPEVVLCPVDPHPLPVRYRREGELFVYCGDYHGRPRDPDGDVAVCLGGRISASLMRVG